MSQDMPSDAATYKVFAFYKGSAFPMLLSVTTDDWAAYKRTADECIVMGLRMGDSITQQSDIHMQLLDKVEACMYRSIDFFELGLHGAIGSLGLGARFTRVRKRHRTGSWLGLASAGLELAPCTVCPRGG